jgi:hypothetical protein
VLVQRQRGKAKRSKAKKVAPRPPEDMWRDDGLLSLATMHAACLSEQLDAASHMPEIMNASVGAALLANSVFLHALGCDDPDCKECSVHFRNVDYRKLAHKVLDMHLDRAAIINLEAEGHA